MPQGPQQRLVTCALLDSSANGATPDAHLRWRKTKSEMVGAIDLNRLGGSVNRRYLLWIIIDRSRCRFAQFNLCAHLLDLRAQSFNFLLLLRQLGF